MAGAGRVAQGGGGVVHRVAERWRRGPCDPWP